jgi:hypothetical protein
VATLRLFYTQENSTDFGLLRDWQYRPQLRSAILFF